MLRRPSARSATKTENKPRKVAETCFYQCAAKQPVIQKAGMYSVTIDLSGKTADNSPFNRTIIRSIYVNDKGEKFENSPLSD